MPLHIRRCDITKMKVDAIVNPSNPRLTPGGGVCGAIHLAAGWEKLARACSKIGFCETGKAVITKGYNLPARYIIHTVGPVYSEGDSVQDVLLYSCYFNSLTLARSKHLKTVAFPIISSGTYRYPKHEALEIARRAISNFPALGEMEIYLVVYDDETFEISKTLFDNVRNYLDARDAGQNGTFPRTEQPPVRLFFYSESDDLRFPEPAPSICAPYAAQALTASKKTLHDAEVPEENAADDNRFDYSGLPTTELSPISRSNPERSKPEAFPYDITPYNEEQLRQTKDYFASEQYCRADTHISSAASTAFQPAPATPTSYKSIDELLKNTGETFSQMLLRLIDERGLKDSHVYKKANIDRKHFSKIRANKNYKPKKSTVLSFAIALELSLDETKDLLLKAGFALSPSSRSDIIVEYLLANGQYNIFEINEVLFAFGQDVLNA